MSFAEFTGNLDAPAGGFVPFTGDLDAADHGPADDSDPLTRVSPSTPTGSGQEPTLSVTPQRQAGAGRGLVNPDLIGHEIQTSGSTANDLVRNFRGGLLGTVAGAGETAASVVGADDVAASLNEQRQELQQDQKESGGNSVPGKAASVVGSVVPALLLPASRAAQVVGNAGLFAIPAFRDTLRAKLEEGQSFPLALAHASESFGVNLFLPTVATRGSGAVVKALGGAEATGAKGVATALGQAGGEGAAFSVANSVLDKGTDVIAGQQNDRDWIDLQDVAANALGFPLLRGSHMAPQAASAMADRLGSRSQQFGRALGQDVDAAQFDPNYVPGVRLNPNLAGADPAATVMAAPTVDDAIRAAADAVASPPAPGTSAEDAIGRVLQREVSQPSVADQLRAIRPLETPEATGAEAAPAEPVQPAATVPREAVDAGTPGVRPLSREEELLLRPAAPAGMEAPVAEMRPDGTLVITGDANALTALLRANGITQILPAREGVLIGRSDAEAAQRTIAPFLAAPRAAPEGEARPENPGAQAPRPEAQAPAPEGEHGPQPQSVWFGRAGDGYATKQDALNAMPARQRAQPDLVWQVEPMPSGKHRLAGYAAQDEQPGQPAAPKLARDPFRTFLIRNGIALRLAGNFTPGVRERLAMGRTFRRDGLEMDLLAQRAAEQGFIRDPQDTDSLYDLISRSVNGERIGALYGPDGEGELQARMAQHRRMEQEQAVAALGALEDNELVAVADVFDRVPDLDAPSNTTTEAAMRSLGFTEQEIADAVAQESAGAQAGGPGRGGAGEAAAGEAPGAPRAGEGQARADEAAGEGLSGERYSTDARAAQGSDGPGGPARTTEVLQPREQHLRPGAAAAEDGGRAVGDPLQRDRSAGSGAREERANPPADGQPAGLTSPTRAEVVAQQQRTKEGERASNQAKQDAERRASADAQRAEFGLTGSDRAADANPAQGDLTDSAVTPPTAKETPSPQEPAAGRESQRQLIELRKRKSVLESLVKCLG